MPSNHSRFFLNFSIVFFFFNDTATTEIYTLSLHDALPISAWPVAIGAVLGVALFKWGDRLPHIPPGDIVVPAEKAFRASYAIGALLKRLDGRLRQWPAATLSLVVIALAMAASAVL